MKRQLKIKQETEQVFNNRLLELLTRTSPLLTLCYYGSVLVLLISLNVSLTGYSFLISLLCFTGAFFSWTLFEYILHRYLFHFIGESQLSKRFHYLVHGVHHNNPHDEARIFMPPVPGTIILLVFFGLFFLFFGDKAFIITAGFLTGYGCYSGIHFMVHIFKPFGPFKYLWKHHARHHFNDESKAFGVSSPLWDYIFRTMP